MTDPRIHERRVLVARDLGRRRRRVLATFLAVVALVVGALLLVHSSVFGASDVEISGLGHVSRAEIVRAAGLTGSPPLIDLSTTAISREIEALPWVRSAEVEISWPSTVRIRLVERVPVAVERSAAGGYALLDDTGRVLALFSRQPPGFPLVSSGVAPRRVGDQAGHETAELASVAAEMPESMVETVADIAYSGEGIVLQLPDHRVAVVGNDSSLHEKFVALATVLAHGGLAHIHTIDLRVPSAPVLIR